MRSSANQEHDRRDSIRLMCRALVAKIRVIHRAFRETYGSPSIWDALLKQDHVVASTGSRGLCGLKGFGPRL
jgi:hypothetical protein